MSRLVEDLLALRDKICGKGLPKHSRVEDVIECLTKNWPEGGGGSGWTEWHEIVPMTEFTPTYDDTLSAPNATLNDFELVAGKAYKIVFDGVEYTCEALRGVLGAWDFTVIGNKQLVGGMDTGEPFGVYKVDGAYVGGIITFDMNPHSVQVFSEVAVPIPVQYVTNALPYYIKATGTDTDEDPVVIHDTAENILSVYKSGRPLVLALEQSQDGMSEVRDYFNLITAAMVIGNAQDSVTAVMEFICPCAYGGSTRAFNKNIMVYFNADGTLDITANLIGSD